MVPKILPDDVILIGDGTWASGCLARVETVKAWGVTVIVIWQGHEYPTRVATQHIKAVYRRVNEGVSH